LAFHRRLAVVNARSWRNLNMRERIRLVHERPAQIKGDVDDAALVRMFAEGHPRALLASWLRFAPLVHRLLKRSLGADDDVRELAQLVFAQMRRGVADLRHPSALRPLVVALTTTVIRAELRKRWIRRWVGVGRAEAEPRTSIAPPDPSSREALRRLYFILDRLNTEDRIAFAFHFLEGLPLEEVADALHLTQAATQRVLARVWNRIVLYIERDTALLDYLSGVERQGACA
jgi:RNA polymerase sigma-70 factor, ECF subfamily